MAKKPKNKGGRPKEKVSDKVDFVQIERLAELGHTDVEIGYILGYSKRTIDRWKNDEQFMALLKSGKTKADNKVVASLYKKAIGFTQEEEIVAGKDAEIVKYNKTYPPDTTAIIYWLNNRQSDRWRNRQEIQHSGEIKTISETTQFTLKPKGNDK